MSPLAVWACAVGAVMMAVNLAVVLAPGPLRRLLLAFPRSRGPAWLLTAVDLVWASWVVYHADLGRFDGLKPSLFLLTPLAFGLIVFFMDELLAPRALGGLLLLLANPVLNAARWHPSAWHFVMTVLAYAWVAAGIVLVLSPFRFRQAAGFATRTDARCRSGGLARLAFGLLLLVLGVIVF
ncbi:MAG: hypothetical protein NTV49_11335 [Kiritimatiellaeota bacterium]|nr:hypothetical protein [Kiritimatiellota bacterium]